RTACSVLQAITDPCAWLGLSERPAKRLPYAAFIVPRPTAARSPDDALRVCDDEHACGLRSSPDQRATLTREAEPRISVCPAYAYILAVSNWITSRPTLFDDDKDARRSRNAAHDPSAVVGDAELRVTIGTSNLDIVP